MSTLAANSSTTVTLQPGYALYVIGNATATFGAGPDSGRAAFPFTGQAVLGPYTGSTQAITITTGASGVNYQTMLNGEIEPSLRISRNAATGDIQGVETDIGDQISGAAAVAAALGGTTDPNTGDIRLNIIPRTGTLPALLSISGGEGEIASVTGAGQPPALVTLDGNSGGAVQITSCDNVLTVTTASLTATVTTKPDGQKLFFTNSVAGTVYTLTLGAGYFVGQRVVIEADGDTSTEVDLTILDGALALNNASSTYGNAVEVAWTGVGWKYQRGFATRAGNFSESLAGAAAPFSNGAVAIGRGVITVTNDGGFVANTNPANTNVDANNKYEVKLGVGSRSAEGFAELFAAGAAGTFELTTDGAAGSSANRIAFQAGMIYRCRLVVNARIASLTTTNTYWSGIRDFVVCVKSDGTAITVSSVNTLSTDLIANVTGTAPSLAVAGSSGKLTVNFTHGHSGSLNVRAVLEVLGSYGA